MTEDSQSFYYYLRVQHLFDFFFYFFCLHLFALYAHFSLEQNVSETIIKALSSVTFFNTFLKIELS